MGYERWESHIDRAIQKAIQDGQLQDLPGAGKPLNLHSDENVPNEMRMAFKILRDNDLAPDWIMLGKTLEQKEKDLRDTLHRSLRKTTIPQALRDAVERYNDEIRSYNLKVPPGFPHRPLFNLQREIDKAR